MNDEKEIQIAWQIWVLIHRFNDLLFDHYEEDFFHLWLEEGDEEDPFLQPLGVPDIKHQKKMETAGKNPNSR